VIAASMEVIWWILVLLLMFAGLVGTVLPFFPGTILIFAGAVLNYFTLHSVGGITILVLAAWMLLAQIFDVASGAIGAKWSGSTRWGVIGGIVGAIVGLFFGLIGLFVAPLLGALIGEILGGKGPRPAIRSAWGTFLGTTAGLIVKLIIAVIMVGWFAVAALLP